MDIDRLHFQHSGILLLRSFYQSWNLLPKLSWLHKKLPPYITTKVLNQSWKKMTGLTLTQEVPSYLEILKVSCLQLKTLEKYPIQGNPWATYRWILKQETWQCSVLTAIRIQYSYMPIWINKEQNPDLAAEPQHAHHWKLDYTWVDSWYTRNRIKASRPELQVESIYGFRYNQQLNIVPLCGSHSGQKIIVFYVTN